MKYSDKLFSRSSDMEEPVPLVLVGCGAVSRFFYASAIQALAPQGWVHLRALVDPVVANREQLAQAFPQASQHERLDEVTLSPEDLVIVATPPRFHSPLAVHALAQGASVLVEKPIACTVSEGRAMLAAEQASQGFLAVGHVRRFYASTVTLKEIIEGGVLGRLQRFEITECAGGWQAASDSFFRPEVAGGGVFLDVGIHILDQLDAWLGIPQEVLYADDAMGGLEANAICRLRYASGAEGVLRLSKERVLKSCHEFEFERGKVCWQVGKPDTLGIRLAGSSHSVDGSLRRPDGLPCPTDPQSFIEQLRHVAAVKAGLEKELRISGSQALRALEVVEKAYAGKTLLPMAWLNDEEIKQGAEGQWGAVSIPLPPKAVAITGASGFVGTRLVEMMHLGSWPMQPIPLVRSPNSLARLARFALPTRTVDLFDVESVVRGLKGCDTLVHAALGDPGQIVKMAECVAQGCAKAGVKRVVVVSTAAVFGLVAPEGSGDDTPPNPPLAEPYALAKWRAEKIFRVAAQRHGFECVILRPSLIYGPRSDRMERLWRQIENGTAGVVDQGRGVFNGIYVDNLVEAIHLALHEPKADGMTFYVGDAESTTWEEVYQALGVEVETLPSVKPPPAPARGFGDHIRDLAAHPLSQKVMPLLPWKLKSISKRILSVLPEPPAPNAWVPVSMTRSVAFDFELAWLQTTAWRFPQVGAERVLGYKPPVSFAEGMRRTYLWMKFPNA